MTFDPSISAQRGIHFGTVTPPNVGQRPTSAPGSSLLWDSTTLTVAQSACRPTTAPKWILLTPDTRFGSIGPHLMEPIRRVVRPSYVETSTEPLPLDRLRPSADFEVFYRRSWSGVYRPLAATLGDAELASEAVDEAMVRAYSKWRSVRKMSNAEGWVYRVAC